MITKINLPQCVPFTKQSELDEMKRVCFIFGPNGSGKTTISRLIYNEAQCEDSSVLEWNNGQDIKTYVYNRDFVSKNFKAEIPGIFTMGTENIEAKKRISELTEEINKAQQKLENNRKNLIQAQKESDQYESEIADVCWKIKSELLGNLSVSWKGTGIKKKFKDDVFNRIEALNQNDVLPDINALKVKVAIIFDESIKEVDPLEPYSYADLLIVENASIFTKPIVGKENIAISDLIKRLGNSDWVNQGRNYINGDVCPFCQQHSVSEKLKSELESFFDESYQKDISELKELAQKYKNCSYKLIETATNISDVYRDFVDLNSLKVLIADLKRIVQNTTTRINEKLAKPSMTIEIVSAKDICIEIAKLINAASLRVNEHNKLVKNRKKEKEKFFDDLMLLTAISVKGRTEGLIKHKNVLQKKIDGLTKSINQSEADIETNKKIERLRRSV